MDEATQMVGKKQTRDQPILTHIDSRGEARMVDVSAKPATERTAVAEGRVGPRQQRAGRRRHVGLPHQAFADQECRHADARQPREIG